MSAIGGFTPEQAAAPIEGELADPTPAYVRTLGTGVLVVGAITVVCGIVAVAWPKITLLALVILILSWPKESLGTLAILTGIAFIIRAC